VLTTDVLAVSGSFLFEWEDAEGAGAYFRGETAMVAIRTTQKVVRFKSAFSLPGFDSPQPPGEYFVDHDEEPIEGVSRIGWRRVATFIYLPAISERWSRQQMVQIDPAFLDAALEQDQ
jgi:hypothetical protein